MTIASNVAILAAACRDSAGRSFARGGRLLLLTFKAYAEARRRRVDIEVLRRFDEHLLKDIGLNPYEIRRVQPTEKKYPSPFRGSGTFG